MSSLKYKYGETIKLNKELINIACCCYDLTFFLDKDRMITAVAVEYPALLGTPTC